MVPQKIKDPEAKAMATIRQNPNRRPVFQDNNVTRCEYCKKEGHNKEECCGFKKEGG
jgi:hypothetical protein